MQRTPAKKRFNRVLVVRQLAAQTAWIDSSPRWHEGRVRWPFRVGNQERWRSPAVSELAAAERALNKIANYPRALEMAFGEENCSGEKWLAQRRAQLHTVKSLARLDAPDLASLSRSSHAQNPATQKRLFNLLSAEALCHNALPVSPAVILQRWPADIAETLHAFCQDENQPPAARLLAALIFGARGEKTNSFSEKQLRSAWQWGRDFGLSQAPGFTARLLLADNSGALATRFAKALPLTQKLHFDLDFWGELAAKRPTKAVLDLMEAILSCEGIEWQHPQQKLGPKLEKLLAQLQTKQSEAQAKFLQLLQNFAREGDAATIHSLREFAVALLEVETPLALWAAPPPQWQLQRGNPLLWPLIHLQVSRHILFALREVQKLAPEKRGAAFRLLTENAATIWDTEFIFNLPRHHDLSKQTQKWLAKKWDKNAKPLLQLISNFDEPTVRRSIALKVLHELRYRHWRDPALAAWAFDLAESFATEDFKAAAHLPELFDLLTDFPDSATARAEVGPLFETLRSSEVVTRGVLANAIVTHLSETDKSQRNAARIRFYLPVIARLAPKLDPWDLSRFADAALFLDKEMRRVARETFSLQIAAEAEDTATDLEDNWQETSRWLSGMADEILRTMPQNDDEADPVIYSDLKIATLLSWLLSDGVFERFQTLFSVAVRRDFDYDTAQQMRRALLSLQNYPAARPALSRLFAAQPARIETLLKRWGLTLRLGDVQKPLDVLREKPTSLPLAWRELLEITPEAWPHAAQLAHAQILLGRENVLPPGLQRVLDMPRKIENERAHLASRHAQTPRDDWAARLAMLERRLNNRQELHAVMATEIQEKLRDMAAHIMLEAIEKQVADCYRARLQEVAGPLPNDLILDDNWLNAVLLTADIEHNRKSLRHLLRALLNGETNWHQTQPANVQFLQDLSTRGVDTKVWLSQRPRRFQSARGAFRLQLEAHPLAILQMGNYFDTCLSFGGINSFSTVANACELNKRVIFARDEKNRVIGRKLIGINEDGKLIGFHTYTSLQDAEANRELQRTFARYCEIFAQKCGLEMAQEGTIPRLFAENWYDDGVVNWHSEDDKKGKPSNPKDTQKSYATTTRIVAKRPRRRTAKAVF